MIDVLLIHQILPAPEKLADAGISLLVVLVVALGLWQLSYFLIGRMERWLVAGGRMGEMREERARTIGQILRNLATVVVFAGAVIQGLDVFELNVGPLLAGAGLIGVALGFGAQTLVRDVIAGFFILVEDQFSVGEVIEVNGSPATVEAMTLRYTQLRDFNGWVHFVPNGEMKIVTNRSRGWSRAVVDVPVDADTDVDLALEACRRAASSLDQDPAWQARLTEPIQVWGVETLAGAEPTLRLVLRGRPGGDVAEASRELRRRVLKAFTEAGIRMRTMREMAITPSPAERP